MIRQQVTIAAVLFAAASGVARQPERGYRGFADWSNNFRTEDMWGDGNRSSVYYTGISTSHGYQINPHFFVGAGLDFEHCPRLCGNMLSMFAHGRGDFKFGRFTPFGDVRIGYNFTDGGGVYFSPTIGYRFNWGRKAGINIGAGLTLQGYKVDVYGALQFIPDGYWTYIKTGSYRGSYAYFSFRVGFDF